jgi:hypothetical protein
MPTKRFHDGMCVNAAGKPDSSIAPEDAAALADGGVLTDEQIGQLVSLGGVTVNVLSALLQALVSVASQVDTATVTAAGVDRLAAITNAVGAVKAEFVLRSQSMDRRAADAAVMVASIAHAAACAAETTAAGTATRLPRISRLAARAPARVRPLAASARATALVASAGGHGVELDAVTTVLADAMRREYQGRHHWAGDRTTLLSLRAEVDEARRLGSDEVDNTRKLDAVTGPQALAASGGICGPVSVDYGVTSISQDSRPVQGAMATFQATRGGLRYVLPQTLAQVTATGPAAIWTQANDVNPTAPATKPHATFVCQPVQESYVDAITSIAQFGNFQARYFPEQVAEFLSNASAVHSRLAEGNLLSQLSAGSTQVSAGAYEMGAARETLGIIDRAASAMRFRHRMTPGAPLRLVWPLFLRDMIRADLAKNLPGDSGGRGERLAVADAEISAWFSLRHINITDTQDSPTGAATLQGWGVQGAGQLLPWPATVATWLYPEGTWLFLDGGSLDLGMVRDSALNATNNFQMFSETFEKAVFLGHESHQLNLHVAPTGASIGTVAPPSEPVETIGS